MFRLLFVIVLNAIIVHGFNYSLIQYHQCESLKVFDLSVSHRMEKGKQLISVNYTGTEDLSNDNAYSLKIFKIIDGKSLPLVDLSNEGACNAWIMFGGGPALDGMKHMKPAMPHPDKCPIEKNTYTVVDHYIDVEQIPLKGIVPKGIYNLNAEILSLDLKKKLMCVDVTVNLD